MKRITGLILCMVMLFTVSCTRQDAPAPAPENTASSQEAESAGEEEEAGLDSRPEITSDNLVHFSAQLTDGDIGYRYEVMQRSDPNEAQVIVTAIPRAEGYESHTVTVITDRAVLDRFQGVIAERDLINTYCNKGEEEEAEEYRQPEETPGQDAMSFLFFLYDDGSHAHHLVKGACEVSAEDREALREAFYAFLEEEQVRFYGMNNVYSDEEYLDAFLACAPWDTYTAGDGTTLNLSFGADRVFMLETNGETASGNYKRRVQTAEGSRGTDTLTVTLTTWPVAWEQMMNGGSFIVEKLTVEKDSDTTGTETVTIKKNGTAFSLFDPYFNEEGTITFTRNYTGYFEESMGEEAPEDAGTGE